MPHVYYTCTYGSSASQECHTYITYVDMHGNSASLSVSLNNTVPLQIMHIMCIIYPHLAAVPQPAAISDTEPEATCKLAILCS